MNVTLLWKAIAFQIPFQKRIIPSLISVWLFPLLYSMVLVAVLRNNGITSDPFENGDANCLFVHTVSPGVIVLPVSVFFCAFLAVYMVSKSKLAVISLFTLFKGKVQKGQQGNKDSLIIIFKKKYYE